MSHIPWDELLADPTDESAGLLLCAPVRLMPHPPVAGASPDGTCAECLCAVWLSPSSRRELATETLGFRIYVCCLSCAARHIPDLADQLGEASRVILMPGQADDLSAAGVCIDEGRRRAQANVAHARAMLDPERNH